MESVSEREARIQRLEEGRAERRSGVVSGDPEPDHPVEIAPGRGDLRFTSSAGGWEGSNETFWAGMMLGNRNVSFARIFQSQPWVGAAVMRMLTWAIRVPLKVYLRVDDQTRMRLYPGDHPLASAVVDPWERGSQAQLTMALLGPVLVHGNSVSQIEEGAGEKIRFKPQDWRYTQPIRPWRDSLEGFRFNTDNPQFASEVSIDECLHIAYWSPMGVLGTSPLEQLGTSVSIETAAQKFQNAMFRNGARPPSAISASAEFLGLEKTERQAIMKQLRCDITEIYAGPDNAGKPALLPPGLTWNNIGHTAVEAELIEQRKVARDEICAVYLIPPPMLGILDKATYSNIEVQREMIYTESVGPPLLMIEQYINAQIVREMLGIWDIYVEFDFAGVLRGDRLKEIQALREAIGIALMTPNEARTTVNMPRSDIPQMDEFYMPFNNLAPIDNPPPRKQGQSDPKAAEPVTQSGLILPRNYDVKEYA